MTRDLNEFGKCAVYVTGAVLFLVVSVCHFAFIVGQQKIVDFVSGLPFLDLFVQLDPASRELDASLLFVMVCGILIGAWFVDNEKRSASIPAAAAAAVPRQPPRRVIDPVDDDVVVVNNIVVYNEPPARSKETECVVCQHREKSIAFVPCGHRCCCRTCAEANDKCPVCRSNPIGRFRIYD
jgi:hypothetical protein